MSETTSSGVGTDAGKAEANPKRGGGDLGGPDSVLKKLKTADEACSSDDAGEKKGQEFAIEADAAEDKGSRHSMEDAWVVLLDASSGSPGKLRSFYSFSFLFIQSIDNYVCTIELLDSILELAASFVRINLLLHRI